MATTMFRLEADTLGVNIKKRETVKISEKDWKENVTLENSLEIEIISKEATSIKRKTVFIHLEDQKLASSLYFDMEDVNHVKGSGQVDVKMPWITASSDITCYNNKDYKLTLTEGKYGIANWIEEDEKVYNQEEFLKKNLEDGYVTLEVFSEISVNGETVEDKETPTSCVVMTVLRTSYSSARVRRFPVTG